MLTLKLNKLKSLFTLTKYLFIFQFINIIKKKKLFKTLKVKFHILRISLIYTQLHRIKITDRQILKYKFKNIHLNNFNL